MSASPHNAYQEYLSGISRFLEAAQQRSPLIRQLAVLLASKVAQGRVIHVFGPSHAGLMVQDLFYRAGGLVPIEPLLPQGLMLNEQPITRTTEREQQPGYAASVLNESSLQDGDVLIIASVSGRNPVVTELCQAAQGRGVTVIALTSLTYSSQVSARSGARRLYELADYVIDLPGTHGDASVTLPGLTQPVGPTSTVLGCAILQGLMVQVSAELLAQGIEPPVYCSANLDEGQQKNQRWIDRYQEQLSYL